MFVAVLQAVAALAVSLGLFGLAVYAGRRWGPSGLFQLRPKGDKRLTVVESLTLDPQRRLVLVRLDDEERLILIGEGQVLEARPARAPKPSPTPSQVPGA